MAITTNDIPARPGLFAAAARVLAGIGAGLAFLADLGPKRVELEALGRMTDAELAAMGKTRAGELDRIFSTRVGK